MFACVCTTPECERGDQGVRLAPVSFTLSSPSFFFHTFLFPSLLDSAVFEILSFLSICISIESLSVFYV